MPIVGRGRDKQAVLWDTRNHLRPRGEYAIDMYTFDTRAHAVHIRQVKSIIMRQRNRALIIIIIIIFIGEAPVPFSGFQGGPH